MRHNLKLTRKEKVKVWLDLCDFSYRLMQSAYSPVELEKKLKRIRQWHWQEDKKMLAALGRLSRG